MSESGGGGKSPIRDVLRWPEEDHVCATCRLSFGDLTVEQGLAIVRAVPAAARVAVEVIPPHERGRRPGPDTWSAAEYVCHLRDVYVIFTIRLHRARTEERPLVDPMLNDLRARRFRYAERDTGPVLDELAAAVAGFNDEVARLRPPDWDRTVQRLPGEHRTARWLLRQAAHEGRHHVADLEALHP